MRKLPSLTNFLRLLLQAPYAAADLIVQIGLANLYSRHLFHFTYFKEQLFRRDRDMNVKNSKWDGLFSTSMFHADAVEFLNDLKKIHRTRSAQYPKFVSF